MNHAINTDLTISEWASVFTTDSARNRAVDQWRTQADNADALLRKLLANCDATGRVTPYGSQEGVCRVTLEFEGVELGRFESDLKQMLRIVLEGMGAG